MIRITKQDVIDAEVLCGNTLLFNDFLKLNHGYEECVRQLANELEIEW